MSESDWRFVYFALLVVVLHPDEERSVIAANTYKKLREMGYEVEIHLTSTEDGYTIAMERIPPPKNSSKSRTPVLLLHGLFCSSFVFMLNKTSIALALIDAGFDVWLYNSRGVGLTKEMAPGSLDQSWKYSFHEMGVYDAAACVNYITRTRNVSQIDILGYSMGGTIALVLLSERPEFNKKIRQSILMAPATRLKNLSHTAALLKVWSSFIMEFLDVFEFVPYISNHEKIETMLRQYCERSKRTMNNCRLLLNFLNDVETKVDDRTLLEIIGAVVEPVASRAVKHYVQCIMTGKFQKYDFGAKNNMLKYNSPVPPPYNLSNVNSSIILFHGPADSMVTTKDTKWLVSQLRNVEVYVIQKAQFGHLSYITDMDSKELVVNYIVRKLKS